KANKHGGDYHADNERENQRRPPVRKISWPAGNQQSDNQNGKKSRSYHHHPRAKPVQTLPRFFPDAFRFFVHSFSRRGEFHESLFLFESQGVVGIAPPGIFTPH